MSELEHGTNLPFECKGVLLAVIVAQRLRRILRRVDTCISNATNLGIAKSYFAPLSRRKREKQIAGI